MNVVLHLPMWTWVFDLDLAYLRSIAWFSLLVTICTSCVIRLVSIVLLYLFICKKGWILLVSRQTNPLSLVSHVMKTSTYTVS